MARLPWSGGELTAAVGGGSSTASMATAAWQVGGLRRLVAGAVHRNVQVPQDLMPARRVPSPVAGRATQHARSTGGTVVLAASMLAGGSRAPVHLRHDVALRPWGQQFSIRQTGHRACRWAEPRVGLVGAGRTVSGWGMLHGVLIAAGAWRPRPPWMGAGGMGGVVVMVGSCSGAGELFSHKTGGEGFRCGGDSTFCSLGPLAWFVAVYSPLFHD